MPAPHFEITNGAPPGDTKRRTTTSQHTRRQLKHLKEGPTSMWPKNPLPRLAPTARSRSFYYMCEPAPAFDANFCAHGGFRGPCVRLVTSHPKQNSGKWFKKNKEARNPIFGGFGAVSGAAPFCKNGSTLGAKASNKPPEALLRPK